MAKKNNTTKAKETAKTSKQAPKAPSFKELATMMAKAFTDDAEVKELGTKVRTYEISTSNYGQAIGKGGNHAIAIKTILIGAAQKYNRRVKEKKDKIFISRVIVLAPKKEPK